MVLKVKTIVISLLIILLLIILFIAKLSLSNSYVGNIEVTAHRGASKIYPENTMSAFIGAKQLNADVIELDVQQTKDRKLVVSHDQNLKRTANINKNIIDLTYKEISSYDVGRFKDEKYTGETIPLLSEVLEFAKENNIKLNIELKVNNKEIDFEKQIIDLVNEYNMKDNVVLASFSYHALENIKSIDSSFITVFLSNNAISGIEYLNSADVYSIEHTHINEDLVNRIHNVGKKIYAWTVDNEYMINKMINYNVDSIITNDIELVKKVINDRLK